MAEVSRKRAFDGDRPQHMRKKLRPSELPLSQAKRSTIDNLVHTFRKKGHYDSIRKELLAQYEASPAKDDLLSALKDLVENETDRNPSLLANPPAMAATLIEGAGERINIYGNIMNTISDLLDKLIKEQGLPKMREYRVLEIGAEIAAEEEAKGSKTDEEWAQEAEARRKEREMMREKELEKERQIEREERAKKEERKRREREQEEERERLREEEKERRRKERAERERQDEDRRQKERERITKERDEERERRRKEDEEHEKTRKERIERLRKEHEERERRIQEELDRSRGSRRYRGGRGRSRTPERDRSRDRGRVGDRSRRRSRTRSRTRSRERTKDTQPEQIKVDDDLALQLLLQESEQMKKSRQRPTLERSESLEPPMRKAQPPKSLVPRDPVAARLAKLESKSQSPALRSPSKEPATPTADNDVPMEDAPPIDKSQDAPAKSRWDTAPPLPSKAGPGRPPEEVGMTGEHPALRMIAGLVGTTTSTRIDREMIETTDVHAAAVEVAPEKHTRAVAKPVTILEAHHQPSVVVIARALAPEVAAEAVTALHLRVAATDLAREAQMVLTGTCLEEAQAQLLLRQPVQVVVSVRIVETASAMTVEIASATTADLANVMTAAIDPGAIGPASTTVGTVVDPEEHVSTSLIATSPVAVRRNQKRRLGKGAEAGTGRETETGIGVEMIATGEDARVVGLAAGAAIDVAEASGVQVL
ncbi:hypothetical protein EK21DRAFT_116889 [Setomelanomma holmii]|uniref:BOD1/SHG1 domain-containing protein n=1 Tax=Setomelanomma holmii TaxID=210430 RepID=A0A9P4LI80_9PLEO|nr:hypothetical protein EK21DRAFT_116889 [Setomelanomma holmii]